MTAQPVSENPLHEVRDGRECHFFKKVDKLWVCDCGEARDSAGHPVPPSARA